MRFSPGCKCCGCACRYKTTICKGGAGWEIMDFTIAGFANDTCSNCADYNGTFILCWSSTNSRWESEELATCGTGSDTPRWTLTESGGYFWLEANLKGGSTGGVVQYRVASASFNCLVVKSTLTKVTPVPLPQQCSGTPSTVDVFPCAYYNCTHCSAMQVREITIDISSFPSQDCTCTTAAGTYVMVQGTEFGALCTGFGAGACNWGYQEGALGGAFTCSGNPRGICINLTKTSDTGWTLEIHVMDFGGNSIGWGRWTTSSGSTDCTNLPAFANWTLSATSGTHCDWSNVTFSLSV
jgi:hypothetical protein